MATYAIGDVQGCYFSLRRLLKEINFLPTQDVLWFSGDLVNRGKHSLEVLRFIVDLGDKHRIVLGNHDFHLLVCAYHSDKMRSEDTIAQILEADDCSDLIGWLMRQSLVYYDEKLQYTMVHAGLAPMWDLSKTLSLAKEVEQVLGSHQRYDLLSNLYGDKPDLWTDDLCGWHRLRTTINYCTRMRFCYLGGRLEFGTYNAYKKNHRSNLFPWFSYPGRLNAENKIVFGHWSHLMGVTNVNNVYALDTGCVYGGKLTAMRLEDEKRFTVQADDADLPLKKG